MNREVWTDGEVKGALHNLAVVYSEGHTIRQHCGWRGTLQHDYQAEGDVADSVYMLLILLKRVRQVYMYPTKTAKTVINGQPDLGPLQVEVELTGDL